MLFRSMLQLRYANYPKDYFMGMLPNSQYGPVAVLPSFNEQLPSRRIVPILSRSGNNHLRASGNKTNEVSMASPVNSADSLGLNSALSALSIRATEYLQRWKEVVQFSSKDYSDQMAAQFGIKAPEYRDWETDRKSTRLNSSHITRSRMPSSA